MHADTGSCEERTSSLAPSVLTLLVLNHLQLGVQRYDHIKHLWARIQRIQEIAAEYESMLTDPDKMLEGAAVRIQSLARGKLDRHRVYDIKLKREEKQHDMFEHTEQHHVLEEQAHQEQEFGEEYTVAALKIQQRARGMSERKKHQELKAQVHTQAQNPKP